MKPKIAIVLAVAMLTSILSFAQRVRYSGRSYT